MYTKQYVAQRLDHAVLKPNMTTRDLAENAAMCAARGVGNFCVRPSDVAQAVRLLAGSQTTVSCVVGFPHGAHRPEVKALEARLAIADGARELDMVMNVGRFLSGDSRAVQGDIAAVVAVARPENVLVKVILETCFLTLEQVADACRLAEAGGANFVKTSTGFGTGGATPETIDVMLRTVGTRLGVKASGGVRTWETAVAYLKQGCSRLGVASAAAILDGAEAAGSY